MNSEKVKEIKKVLEEGQFNTINHHQKEGKPIKIGFADILTLINELESENKRLLGVVKEKIHVIGEMGYTHAIEVKKLKDNNTEIKNAKDRLLEENKTLVWLNQNMCKENQQLKYRIAELEKENKILAKDIVFSNDKVDVLGKPVILTIAGVPLVEAYNRIVNYEQDQQVIKELKEQNAKLLDSVETVQAGRCVYKCVLTKEHLTKFAERLKEKIKSLDKWYSEEIIDVRYNGITATDVDETLKEFINE